MPPGDDSPLSALIGLSPEEAIQGFKAKGNRITWDWREMAGLEHARNFTVAKATTLDLLADLRRAVSRALAEGRTEQMFAKDLIPILKAKGWWGEQELESPDGGMQRVQLGSPRRLETIFRTNLQTAYMAGRYQRMMENVEDRPFWQYVAVMDGRTRPSHAALHGRVFRHDDPIWKHIHPPNGFRCRCRVRALSNHALKRRGLAVESSGGHLTSLPVSEGDPWAASVSIRLPGMGEPFKPDRGWDYNPGRHWGRWDKNGLLPDCLDGASFAEGRAGGCIRILPGQKGWRDYGRTDLRDVGAGLRLPAPPVLKPGQNAGEALMILQAALKVDDLRPMRVIETPVNPVVIRAEWLPHLVAKREQSREIFANYIIPTLSDPYEVWLAAYEDGYRKHYLGLFQDERDLLMVVRENLDGSLLWNAIRMRAEALNKRRVGNLLWGKK
ncbi:MAG: minor capsid protein [Magnetococcales bacterium]|nr:minor capsid protein [Magnetococcales bacterium]